MRRGCGGARGPSSACVDEGELVDVAVVVVELAGEDEDGAVEPVGKGVYVHPLHVSALDDVPLSKDYIFPGFLSTF